uniref:Uncharacterized protein n=1 Tax=Nelumbo nucifera TaxID=4432 RepID=A0A822ZTY6_NELNU|nr:TPA_asm: hypothetical protein HUJ06_017957 [Nelumbo nucifera]
MKVSVLVHPLPSLPTVAVSSNHSSSHDRSSQDVFRPGLSILGALRFRLPPSGSESNWVQLV